MQQHQRISTKAMIKKDGKILLVCEPNGKWEMPGGKPDFGEHMSDTIKRELFEELGVKDVEIKGICGQFDFTSECPQYDAIYQFVILVFSVDIHGDQITLSDEHERYGWFDKSEMEKIEMKTEYIEFLRSNL